VYACVCVCVCMCVCVCVCVAKVIMEFQLCAFFRACLQTRTHTQRAFAQLVQQRQKFQKQVKFLHQVLAVAGRAGGDQQHVQVRHRGLRGKNYRNGNSMHTCTEP
jgi:hypothetical protein